MKITSKVLASALTLLVAGVLRAADPKPTSLVLSAQVVETDDPIGYATWVAKTNEVAKAKFGVDHYIRVYESVYDGGKTSSVHAVQSAPTVVDLTKMGAALQNLPELSETRDHLRAMRKLGSRVLCQSVRFEGGYENTHIQLTMALVNDETAYLKALDGLRALFDARNLQDIKIDVFRVMAGRTNYSHIIALHAPTAERLAALLDYVGTDAAMAEWLASAAKLRTVVTNLTVREITK